MVSTLYDAKSFYKLQNNNKVAKTLSPSKKLKLDSKGYYLNKKNNRGESFMQRLNSTDKVYSRQEGVTMYSPARDSQKTKVSHKREGIKKHSKYAHMRDRKSIKGNREFKK